MSIGVILMGMGIACIVIGKGIQKAFMAQPFFDQYEAPMIDIPGLAPKRIAVRQGNGWLVSITPPKLVGDLPTVSVFLTDEQYQRFSRWLLGKDLIDTILSDLSVSDREKLMSGLDNATFHKFTDEEGE